MRAGKNPAITQARIPDADVGSTSRDGVSATRTLMLTSGPIQDYLQILILDNGNFTPVASLPFDSGIDGGTVSGFTDLIYLGDDGVAFLNSSTALGKLYIFRSPVIGTPP